MQSAQQPAESLPRWRPEVLSGTWHGGIAARSLDSSSEQNCPHDGPDLLAGSICSRISKRFITARRRPTVCEEWGPAVRCARMTGPARNRAWGSKSPLGHHGVGVLPPAWPAAGSSSATRQHGADGDPSGHHPSLSPPSGESDAAVLSRLLAVSAVPERCRTSPRMPNAAPPLPRAARRRVADLTSPSVGRSGTSPASAPVASAPSRRRRGEAPSAEDALPLLAERVADLTEADATWLLIRPDPDDPLYRFVAQRGDGLADLTDEYPAPRTARYPRRWSGATGRRHSGSGRDGLRDPAIRTSRGGPASRSPCAARTRRTPSPRRAQRPHPRRPNLHRSPRRLSDVTIRSRVPGWTENGRRGRPALRRSPTSSLRGGPPPPRTQPHPVVLQVTARVPMSSGPRGQRDTSRCQRQPSSGAAKPVGWLSSHAGVRVPVDHAARAARSADVVHLPPNWDCDLRVVRALSNAHQRTRRSAVCPRSSARTFRRSRLPRHDHATRHVESAGSGSAA